MRRKHYGKCALCGKECDLSFEHIPPKSAFNSTPIKPVSGITLISEKGKNNLPWETKGLQYENQQNGMGLFSLCKACNNSTGAWYGDAYRSFAECGAQLLSSKDLSQYHSVMMKALYPLHIFKQIISMFCSINPPTVFDLSDLRKFVLDKDSNDFNVNKYKLNMYFTRSTTKKYNPFSSVINLNTMNGVVVSELVAYPLGFLLYFDPSTEQSYEGFDITSFSNCKYDDVYNVKMPIIVHEVNNWIPNDYRSRAEIIQGVESTEKWVKEHSN